MTTRNKSRRNNPTSRNRNKDNQRNNYYNNNQNNWREDDVDDDFEMTGAYGEYEDEEDDYDDFDEYNDQYDEGYSSNRRNDYDKERNNTSSWDNATRRKRMGFGGNRQYKNSGYDRNAGQSSGYNTVGYGNQMYSNQYSPMQRNRNRTSGMSRGSSPYDRHYSNSNYDDNSLSYGRGGDFGTASTFGRSRRSSDYNNYGNNGRRQAPPNNRNRSSNRRNDY